MSNELSNIEAAAVKYLNSLTLGTTFGMTGRELEEARAWFQAKNNSRRVDQINQILRRRVRDYVAEMNSK